MIRHTVLSFLCLAATSMPGQAQGLQFTSKSTNSNLHLFSQKLDKSKNLNVVAIDHLTTKNLTGIIITDSSVIYRSDKTNLEFTHKTTVINGETFYIVEGDLLLNATEFFQYKVGLSALQDRDTTAKLVVQTEGGQFIRWQKDFVIKYAVIRGSFKSDAEYQQVKKRMDTACKNWQNVCNVRFLHDESADAKLLSKPDASLSFVVLGIDNYDFIAKAFFPNDPDYKRTLMVSQSFFTTNVNQTGILRHELGHVLGFRHEHIRHEAPAVCPSEILSGTMPLTPYDGRSVMHYFCGGNGTKELEISPLDIKGAVEVYGPPKP